MTSSVLDEYDWSENTAERTNLESLYHQMVKNEIKAYKTSGYLEEYSYCNNSLCDTNHQ
jgi:two-component SAPR family response regulator